MAEWCNLHWWLYHKAKQKASLICFLFNKRSPKDTTWENWVLLHTLLLENKAQINKNNYGTMFFMSEQVSLPKISSILQKWKSAQNLYYTLYALFTQNPSIINLILLYISIHLKVLTEPKRELCSVCKNAFSNYLRCNHFVYHTISNSYFLILQTL